MPSFGLCGVILAAGESSRMGRDKALLPWPKSSETTAANQLRSTLLSSSIHALLNHCELVIVVAGANAGTLRPVVYGCGADFVENSNPKLGQFSSLQIGLQGVLNRGRDNAMIALVDRPPLQSESLGKLVMHFRSRPRGIWTVVPEFEGKHGHPILIGREMIEAFLRAPVTASAREVERAHLERIQYVHVDDPLITVNLDTPEAYAQTDS